MPKHKNLSKFKEQCFFIWCFSNPYLFLWAETFNTFFYLDVLGKIWRFPAFHSKWSTRKMQVTTLLQPVILAPKKQLWETHPLPKDQDLKVPQFVCSVPKMLLNTDVPSKLINWQSRRYMYFCLKVWKVYLLWGGYRSGFFLN